MSYIDTYFIGKYQLFIQINNLIYLIFINFVYKSTKWHSSCLKIIESKITGAKKVLFQQVIRQKITVDRKLEQKKWPAKRIAVVAGSVAVVIFVAAKLLSSTGADRLRVDSARLTVATVVNGEFLDYYPFDGVVEPVTTVYMDVEEGGRVDEIFVEAGQRVEKGDLILRISNASLQRSTITAETSLLENLDRLSTTRFERAQSKLTLRENLLNIDFEILEQQKKYERFAVLRQKDGILSDEQFETVSDDLEYMKQRRQLLEERIEQEDLLNEQQLSQTNKSIERLNLSLELLGQITDSLNVRAPISGHVSSIDAELGQNLGPGRRIGQVDVLDSFKLRVEIDQYYLSDVDIGTTGHLTLNQRDYQVITKKIYPEVTDDQFAIDMEFFDTPPELRRGQSLTVELSFSEPTNSLMVEKGGFYQSTGGRWAYLIAEDGESASRINLRLGRQNPRFVEILEGLVEGDRILTSGYDTYNEADELIFDSAL